MDDKSLMLRRRAPLQSLPHLYKRHQHSGIHAKRTHVQAPSCTMRALASTKQAPPCTKKLVVININMCPNILSEHIRPEYANAAFQSSSCESA
jgi:hypothetical protein